MIRGLIRLLAPVALATTAAVFAARAIYGNGSAQALLLVFVGAAAGALLGFVWVIKYVERVAQQGAQAEFENGDTPA